MIAAKAAEQDITRLSWIDYALMGTASGLAVFSGAQAIAAPMTGWILVGLTTLGMAVSALLQASLSEKFARTFGGAAYAVLAIVCLFTWRSFAAGLPEKVLVETRELAPAGFLIWMIVYGSYAAWRDQTLLFQAVPCIAIFGLVGCYDTYRPAPFLFFGFLLCLCTMFARAHARAMLYQAAESGYRARAAQEALAAGKGGAGQWVEAIRQGPWKWVAGPEWALASAASVVLISLLGAPVIQRSVSGVSGFVRINVPVQRNQNRTPSLFPSAGANNGAVRVGQGPNRLTDTPLYKARLDQLRYLRAATYLSYNGIGWEPVRGRMLDATGQAIGTIAEDSRKRIKEPVTIDWEIERIARGDFTFPAPGEILELVTGGNRLQLSAEGTLYVPGTGRSIPVVRGRSIVDGSGTRPEFGAANLPLSLDPALNTERIPDRVMALVMQSTKDAGNDYEKASAWKSKIADTVKYNINAARTPDGVDPVEHFLFGSKEGYCDLFASAMVLGARALNIPARYVVGFLPEPDQDADGRFTLKESDSHAWAELYFEDKGWVVFDATEGAESVPGGERGESNVGKEWFRQPIVIVLFVLVGAAGLGAVIFFAYKRMDGAHPSVDPIRKGLNREYDRFARALGKAAGQPKLATQTPDEFFAKIEGELGENGAKAREISRQFVRAYYSPDRPAEADVARLKDQVRELESSLRKR